MTDWNMRTEDLELKDGSIVNNYHYEFNTTDSMFAKIVEDVLKVVIDIAREKLAEYTEPKRGEWIWQSSMIGSFTERRYKCSNCGYGVVTQREEPRYNFCPNCGADMRR